jgi:hypothetical protein
MPTAFVVRERVPSFRFDLLTGRNASSRASASPRVRLQARNRREADRHVARAPCQPLDRVQHPFRKERMRTARDDGRAVGAAAETGKRGVCPGAQLRRKLPGIGEDECELVPRETMPTDERQTSRRLHFGDREACERLSAEKPPQQPALGRAHCRHIALERVPADLGRRADQHRVLVHER